MDSDTEPREGYKLRESFEQVWKEKYFKNNNNTVMVHIEHLSEKRWEVMGHKRIDQDSLGSWIQS